VLKGNSIALAFSLAPNRFTFRSMMRRSASSILVRSSMHMFSDFSFMYQPTRSNGRLLMLPIVERGIAAPTGFFGMLVSPTRFKLAPRHGLTPLHTGGIIA
jgi:hypothetical protein